MSDTRIASTEIHELAEQMRTALMKHPLRPTVYVYAPSGDDPLYHIAVEATYGRCVLNEADHIDMMEVCSDLEREWVALHGIEVDLTEIEEEPSTRRVPKIQH